MEYFRCENPECGYIMEGTEPEVCPRCGGIGFLRVYPEALTGQDLMGLAEQAKGSGEDSAALNYAKWAAGFFDRGVEDGDARNIYQRAVEFFRRYAQAGNVEAASALGLCYAYGHGVERSWEDAVKWYQTAAEAGNPEARCNLGLCYEHGLGVQQSWEDAVEWYRAAAEQDYFPAQCQLGFCYQQGHGVEKDMEKAIRYYTLAADRGDQRAKAALERLGQSRNTL